MHNCRWYSAVSLFCVRVCVWFPPTAPVFSGQYWNFTAPDPANDCLYEIDPDNITSCVVYFAVCKPLPSSICGSENGNASYCQVVTAKDGKIYRYNVGNYSQSHKFSRLGMFKILWLSDGCVERAYTVQLSLSLNLLPLSVLCHIRHVAAKCLVSCVCVLGK